MRILRYLLLFLALAGDSALGAGPVQFDCASYDLEVRAKQIRIPSHLSGRKVIGKGRLNFYSAPSKDCRIPGLFVVPGDTLDAYADFGSFTSILYVNPKTGRDAAGWVESSRLIEAGTGIGPAPKKEGRSPIDGRDLYSAIQSGNLQEAEKLISEGADIHYSVGAEAQITTSEFPPETPLELAIQKGYAKIVQLMIRSPEDANSLGTDGRTPLMHAISVKNIELVSILLSLKADPNAATNFSNRTALSQAVDEGDIAIVRRLLDAGADAAATDKYGNGPAQFTKDRKIKQLIGEYKKRKS